MQIQLGGESVYLYPDRALYWPRTRALLVADVHLGKAQQLRRAGIGIPEGVTQTELVRLSTLVCASDATTLCVLGDFVHGAIDCNDPWVAALCSWQQKLPRLAIKLLVGNHDRSLSKLPLRFESLGQSATMGPFQLVHAPDDLQPGAGFALCGHVHPIHRSAGMRVPCFWQTPKMMVLPAFSSLAGGCVVKRRPNESLHVCTDAAVFTLA